MAVTCNAGVGCGTLALWREGTGVAMAFCGVWQLAANKGAPRVKRKKSGRLEKLIRKGLF